MSKLHEYLYYNYNAVEMMSLSRIKVHGGWALLSNIKYPEFSSSQSMIFIDDPKHEWVIDNNNSDDRRLK